MLARRLRFIVPALVAAAVACGGGVTSPVSAQTAATSPVSVVVFYDENGNGVLDPGEAVRLPGVTVRTAAGQAASTSSGGTATLMVPAGAQSLTVSTDSLPTYFQPGAAVMLNVPQQSQAVLPVTLAIGSGNRPNTYMAFGDSITVGEGSSSGEGYRGRLQGLLQGYFGRGEISDEGISATRSRAGAERIGDSLRRQRPAFTLIHYGTNDWNEAACRSQFPCFTIDSLRTMLRETRAQGGMPVLATIIPTNTDFNPFVPQIRNDWLELMNASIREMAKQENCVVADMWVAFFQVREIGDLYFDHVHPNDAGYKIMADTFFAALTRARGATTAADAQRPIFVPELAFMRPEAIARTRHWPLEVPRDPVDSPGRPR